MTTIKDAMDRAARECSLTPPASWISTTLLSYAELKDFLAETVEELQERIDWPSPIGKETVIAGDGSEDYDLPSDFLRLTRDPLTVYETTTTRRAGVPVSSSGAWTHLKDMGSAGGDRFYRLQGDETNGFTVGFYREPASGDSITVSYISRNWMQSAAGTAGETWAADDDVLLFPRRIVELGVVYRFRRRKGLAYADILGEFEMKLARQANDARGIRTIDMGGPRVRSPFDIPVPDYIPSSS